MTKEKLKQEAEELIQRFEIANSMNCYMSLTPDRKQIGEMLLMFAESREKRIAELEAQIEKMKCCGNCRWEEPSSFCDNCKRLEGQIFADTLTSDNWELRK